MIWTQKCLTAWFLLRSFGYRRVCTFCQLEFVCWEDIRSLETPKQERISTSTFGNEKCGITLHIASDTDCPMTGRKICKKKQNVFGVRIYPTVKRQRQSLTLLGDLNTFYCYNYLVLGGIRTWLGVFTFQWSDVPVDFFAFLPIKFAASSKPTSRNNHRKVSYLGTQQHHVCVGWHTISKIKKQDQSGKCVVKQLKEILLEISFIEEMKTTVLQVIKRCPKPFCAILFIRENTF